MMPEGLTRPAAPRAPAPARPGAPAKPATPAMPPRTFESPLAAWKALIKETARPLLEDAAFLGVADGFVQLAIRQEGSRFRVEGSLLGLDLRPWFPLCQGARLIVDASIGQTGWERRSTRDRERREGAISAAQASEAIRLLAESLGALLIVPDIEPPDLPAEEVIEEEG